jgi:crotonyl-CoA reductase
VQEILDAIQAEQFDALAGVAVPDHYRGVTVHADEVDMFAGIPSRRRTRGRACTSTRSPRPSSGRARRSSP